MHISSDVQHTNCQGLQIHTFCTYKTGTSITLRHEISMLCQYHVP